MARKEVSVELRVKVVLSLDGDVDPEDVVEDMEYSFESQTDGATVQDTEIRDWDVSGADDGAGAPHLAAMDSMEE